MSGDQTPDVSVAVAAITAYLRLLPGAVNLGAEFAFGSEFRSKDWPHDAYGLLRTDVETVLAALEEARVRLARIDAALDTLEGYGGPDTHDAYLQIRRASTATCEKCGKRIPGPTESGWWFCDPCLNKDRKRRRTYNPKRGARA